MDLGPDNNEDAEMTRILLDGVHARGTPMDVWGPRITKVQKMAEEDELFHLKRIYERFYWRNRSSPH